MLRVIFLSVSGLQCSSSQEIMDDDRVAKSLNETELLNEQNNSSQNSSNTLSFRLSSAINRLSLATVADDYCLPSMTDVVAVAVSPSTPIHFS